MKNIGGKKLLSVVLALCMTLTVWSVPVLAENRDIVHNEYYGITITKTGGNGDVLFTENTGFLITSGDYKISGTWTGDLPTADNFSKIRSVFTVGQGETVNITLDNVTADTSDKINACAFLVEGTANITLIGDNRFVSGAGRAGLEAVEGASVTIKGPGSLTAVGGVKGAGIGGGFDPLTQNGQNGGIINIEDGATVYAQGTDGGAGVGGGAANEAPSIKFEEGSGSHLLTIGQDTRVSGRILMEDSDTVAFPDVPAFKIDYNSLRTTGLILSSHGTNPYGDSILLMNVNGATLTIASDGRYTFELTDENILLDKATVTFGYKDAFGAKSNSLTIEFLFNKPPTLISKADLSLTEDDTEPASGQITASDPDGDTFSYGLSGTGEGNYGTFAVKDDGSYTYTLDNSKVQFLDDGETATETFTVSIEDGRGGVLSCEIKITITGINDPFEIISIDDLNLTDGTKTTDSGRIVVYDPEGDAFEFRPLGTHELNYGALELKADGSYTYTLDASKAQTLGDRERAVDLLKVKIVDMESLLPDAMASYFETCMIGIYIRGTNDPPALAAFEDIIKGAIFHPVLFTGDITITDPDANDTHSFGIIDGSGNLVNSLEGVCGVLTIDVESKKYAYTYKGDYVSGTESFRIRVSDGNGGIDEKELKITISPSTESVLYSGTLAGTDIGSDNEEKQVNGTETESSGGQKEEKATDIDLTKGEKQENGTDNGSGDGQKQENQTEFNPEDNGIKSQTISPSNNDSNNTMDELQTVAENKVTLLSNGIQPKGGNGAVLTVKDSVLSASSIGGGEGQPKGGEGTKNYTNALVMDGAEGTVYGNAVINADFTVKNGQTLTIGKNNSLTVPKGVTLTIDAGGKMINNGTLTINGQLMNNGTLEDNSKTNGSSSSGGGSGYKGKRIQTKDDKTEDKDEMIPLDREGKPIFTDVSVNDWFYDAVMGVYDKGIMSGTGDGKFSPNTPVTRAMAITVLWRMSGSPEPKSTADFTDVSQDEWYFDALSWMWENGLVSGYDNKRFGPDDYVTREQMISMLYRWAQFNGADVSVGEDTNILSYTDALEISEWAVPAFRWACGEGIVKGRDGGRLDPKSGAGRAELAAILYRL